MRVPKRFIIISVIAAVIGVIVYATYAGISYVNDAWNNPNTWTTEQALILPVSAKDLKTTLEGSLSQSGEFSFTTEFCYLYKIETTDDSATLKCSLLPVYYSLREQEIPKDWSDTTDIKLLVKKSDVEPSIYLGRIDRSFDSVQSFGSAPIPVSMKIKGRTVKIEKTLTTMYLHALVAMKGGKDTVGVELTEYEVARLDQATAQQKTDYAKNWAANLKKELQSTLSIAGIDKNSGLAQIDVYRSVFEKERVKCTKLSTCDLAYENNPAERFIYYLYSLENWNIAEFERATNAMSENMYPFKPVTSEPSVDHWEVFNSYMFPICPVNDLQKSSNSASYEYFKKYMKGMSDGTGANNGLMYHVTTLTANRFEQVTLQKEFMANGLWTLDTVTQVNEACLFALENKKLQDIGKLNTAIERAYYNMLSVYLGKQVDGSKAALEEIIYSSVVYSPYKTQFLSDGAVSRYREDGLETVVDAAQNYVEWRSVFSSLLVMYLYENR